MLPLLCFRNGHDVKKPGGRRDSPPAGWICVATAGFRFYEEETLEDSRPVSRAHPSTLLHRQTEERPSVPIGFGKPGPEART